MSHETLRRYAFRVDDFAALVAKRLAMNEGALRKCLWDDSGGEFYFNPKTRKVGRSDEDGRLKPMFVQFVLEQIWSVAGAFLTEPDADKVSPARPPCSERASQTSNPLSIRL